MQASPSETVIEEDPMSWTNWPQLKPVRIAFWVELPESQSTEQSPHPQKDAEELIVCAAAVPTIRVFIIFVNLNYI